MRVESNFKESSFEVDSHADTTCLGSGALNFFDYDCPVNVQGYDIALGVKQYQTISGAVGYRHPFTGQKYHLIGQMQLLSMSARACIVPSPLRKVTQLFVQMMITKTL